MLQIQIDGKQLSVEQGSTVIEAAHQAGTFIPHFCYHKKLSIAANCRMCLVEVEKSRKPLPACATPVTDGMVVKTNSPMTKDAQKGVMEFLLINHPLDCPICDQGGECLLQDLSMGYGKGASRYTEAKHAVVGKEMGPLVSAAEMSRCIHCTRCIRFTEEIAGKQELAMKNRGEHSEITPFAGKTLETELSGNVIDLCPVGALTSKPFRYDSRSWELSRRKSISAHDALGSNLIVQTKDHTVRRVLPLENEAINECWLSDRDRFAYAGLYQQRLTQPQIKQNNQWHTVDWQTALDYVAKGLHGVSHDFGADGIGMWVNPANTVEEMHLARKLADGLGINAVDSRLRSLDSRLTAAEGAQWLGQSIEQLAANEVILVIGARLRQEQPLLTARIRQATKNGTKVAVLAAADEELFMPLLAQVSLHPYQWIDWLSDALNSEVGQTLLQAQKASIILGADVLNHPDAAAVYAAAQDLAVATDSILGILPQAANSIGAEVLGVAARKAEHTITAQIARPKQAVMLLNVEPDIDVANGAAAIAALKQAQTVMAFSAYDSEVLREVADVMLPITPFTETSGSFINMEGRLQSFHGVVQAYGEARPLWKVLRVLGNVLELPGFEYENTQQILTDALAKDQLPALLSNQIQPVATTDPNISLVRVGGVSLYASDGIVRRSAPLQNTVHAAVPTARIHSTTLNTLGLADGDTALARQGNSTVAVTVAADDTLPENVLLLPLHQSNWQLGALLTTVELSKG
ncbi:NADH-quinone oxidoreductase subunit G [Snodgrassella communis]|uniref:NADH-quinone oxidoreductase n=1 Tax=Snodgrassella communis TaxID=2946699 RepID=A0A836Z472_9NEIS|nr:NADH-quinone oxidoreductase subunit NuoG [Snodgrassella communis]KDN14513.1 NADH-ubiquinone oxidoreductase chain G [Snodgrassella communis]PIT08069.1 NADH-quinone oxidoreductase subunit G [Snodgrassella communis]PIT26238.1 NADH-quinone oxidoreductase subunit G [Snodgrassella communis]PIT27867.1 NADH-quinone oxidoreductase subunit G [Snodgrassella communis]PIT30755.1 NADH-quinone oxidoreductase subunit G [Snodgrassella communis]